MSRIPPRYPTERLLAAGLLVAALLHIAAAAEAQTPRFTITTIGQDVGADAGPQAIQLANVNRDMRADLIAINRLDDSTKVLIRLAQEDGSFGEATEVDVLLDGDPEVPTAIAVGDIGSSFTSPNEGARDGNPDIVVATDFGEAVLLVGSGDGNFEVRDEPGLDGVEVGVALADFDGDSNLDIVGIDADVATIYFNRGTFFDVDDPIELDPVNESDAIDVATGDFDGNRAIDVIMLNEKQQTVALFLASSPGVFDEEADPILRSTMTEQGGFPSDFAVADLERDGIDNVVVINFGVVDSEQLTIMSGQRIGTINLRPAPFQGTGLALANFNGDSQGNIDAVLISEDEMAVFAGGDGTATNFDPAGGFGITGAGTAIVVAAGDINNDGRPDFVSLDVGGTELNVAINQGGAVTPGPTTPPTGVATGTPTPTRPTNTPPPTATPTRIPTVPLSGCNVELRGAAAANVLLRPVALRAGDVDGNATQDLVVADGGQGKVFVALLDPSRFDRRSDGCMIRIDPTGAPAPAPTPTPGGFYVELDVAQPMDVALGQLSRPERQTVDLAVVGSGGLTLFFGDGRGGFPDSMNIPVDCAGGESCSVTISDLDLDGMRDIIVARHNAAELRIYKGAGNRSFEAPFVLGVGDRPITVLAEQLDDDDFPDLAVAADRLGSVRVFYSPGRFIQTDPTPTPTPAAAADVQVTLSGVPTDLSVEDFNNDGLLDLVATLGNGSFVTLIAARSGGTVTFNTSNPVTVGGLPMAVGAGRFNPDPQETQPDVVVADFRNDRAVFFFRSGDVFTPQDPATVGGRPVALVVSDFDSDRLPDVVIAAEEGNRLTLLRSSVPPSTPTPTHTFSVTPTATVTNTRPTDTATPTGTITNSPLPSRTPTPTERNTPKEGAFELSDGCSIDPDTGGGFWPWAFAAVVVWLWRRAGHA